jgi:hypothetical protein
MVILTTLADPWLWLYLALTAGIFAILLSSAGLGDLTTWLSMLLGLVASVTSPVASGGAAASPWVAVAEQPPAAGPAGELLARVLPFRPRCEVVMGFALLEAHVGPSIVGSCLEAERFDPSKGLSEQRTSGGLLVWRKDENLLAFTDGYRTWLLGSNGVVQRLNTQRYCWEADASPADCLRTAQRPPAAR